MTRAGAVLGVLGLVGAATSLSACMTVPEPKLACAVGQEPRRTAQLFFGRSADVPKVQEADFRVFADKELAPRFPDGLTVLDGGAKWRGDENKQIREAAKVVLIVLPKNRDATGRLDAVRAAYKARFHKDALLVVTQPACVSL